jgi:acyl-coenzyme A thioesterase PaaI-like protein
VDADTGARAARHILNDLGFVVRRAGDEVHGSAEIVPEMGVPGTGHLRTSILATWVDHVSGLAAMVPLAPRVPVTLELDVHVYGHAPGSGTVHAAARVLKAGRSVVVCGVDVVDDDGIPVAIGNASFMAAPDHALTMPEHTSLDDLMPAPGTLDRPFAEHAHCQRVAPGVAELQRHEHGLNAAGTINGGLIALVAEEAALSLSPGATLASMALRYLRPVRSGPAVATAEVRAGLGRVAVVDAGTDGRPAVTAITRATPPA